MIPAQLETTHLVLRPFETQDARAVFEYWQSDSSWERYNASIPENFQLADAQTFIFSLLTRDRQIAPSWALLYQNSVVGVVSLTFEQNERVAVIGYGIHQGLRGRNLVVEAAKTVIGQAFTHYPDLTKIRAHLDPENHPSIRVLEKLNFSHEGTLRQNQYVKGRFVDEAVYGLLRPEWEDG